MDTGGINLVTLNQDALIKTLANAMQLPLVDAPAADDWVLGYVQQQLQIWPVNKQTGPITCDFVGGKNRHRRLYGGGKSQQLAKAIGIKDGLRPTVLDVTAGLGADAFVLASLGCTVCLVERHPVVRALLENGLQGMADDTELLTVQERMQLLTGTGMDVLNAWPLPEPPQVIYMDPMFPFAQHKSAQVNKSMALFRDLVGADADSHILLSPAIALASHRVVVKRPRIAPTLTERQPTYQIIGKANRFDIYVNASFKRS